MWGRVVTAFVASARNVSVEDIGKTLALRGLRQQAVSSERNAQRPDSMDESVLCRIQDPFQIDTHRQQLEGDDEAGVQTSGVSCRNAVDSAMLAHFLSRVAYQTAKIQ